jgi:hypothetical protein
MMFHAVFAVATGVIKPFRVVTFLLPFVVFCSILLNKRQARQARLSR